MQWFMAITAAPRDPAMLSQTIHSLQSAGWWESVVFAEPDTPVHPSAHEYRWSTETLGPWKNFLRAFEAGYETGADYIAIAQDDVIAAKGLRKYLEGNMVVPDDDAGAFSPYTNEAMQTDLLPESDLRWRCHENQKCAARADGACFYVIPRRSAEILHAKPVRNAGVNATDRWIDKHCRENQLKIYWHRPSLVQHIGKGSTIHESRDLNVWRRACDFVSDVREIEDV